MMADKKAEIEELIGRLVPAVVRLAQFDDYDDVIPRAGAPASPAAIETYEKYLGIRLPPYYRAFLELHDGYEALAFPGRDLLSIESVMPGGAHHGDIAEWKKLSTETGAGEVLDAIVIANSDQPNNWDYLDLNRFSAGGELVVVRWTASRSLRFPNFHDYLEQWCLATSMTAYESIKAES